MFTPQDNHFMQLAVNLAEQARMISQPNPRVGCVMVKDHQIIGQGFTQRAGSHHAEIMALRDLQEKGLSAKGATAYVTLEPCCHHGKTPPCTKALIKAGVQKVIIGSVDPNPLVAGQGIAELRAHGIEVIPGLLATQVERQNPGFMKRMRHGLPWVRMKVASSLDSVTALPNGVSQWITSEEARHDGHRWRAQASVLLTGMGTVRVDNPELTVRGIDIPTPPLRVVIDSKLEIPMESKILHNGPTLLICAIDLNTVSEKYKALENLGGQVVSIPNARGKVDLPEVFRYLAKEHQANEVHLESGYKLNGSMLREHCVDELLMYIAPKLLGSGSSLAEIGPFSALSEGIDLELMEHVSIGPDLRLRFFVKN